MSHAQVWSLEEAIVAVLYSAAAIDGSLEEREREELLHCERRSKTLASLTHQDLSALNARVVERLRYGGGTLADACAMLSPEFRLPVFALALDLMMADGDLAPGEADFVNTLVLRLNLSGVDVERVSEVIVLKNSV